MESICGFNTNPVRVDGNQCPRIDLPVEAIVGGDQFVLEISAASILAKVARDQEMIEMDALFPGYGFAQHKGYPTRAHSAMLEEKGALPVHRRTFRPVREVLSARGQNSILSPDH